MLAGQSTGDSRIWRATSTACTTRTTCTSMRRSLLASCGRSWKRVYNTSFAIAFIWRTNVDFTAFTTDPSVAGKSRGAYPTILATPVSFHKHAHTYYYLMTVSPCRDCALSRRAFTSCLLCQPAFYLRPHSLFLFCLGLWNGFFFFEMLGISK